MNTQTAQETQAQMLKNKMIELQSALFFNDSSSIVKLPTHVTSEIEIDEEEQIWFVIPKPVQHIDAFDKEIPAKLDFFKKGKEFFVKVSGLATIVWSEKEVACANLKARFPRSFEKDGVVAVKVKIEGSEYAEKTTKPSTNPLLNVGSQVYNWLLNPLFNA